jgi:hypothetical protein
MSPAVEIQPVLSEATNLRAVQVFAYDSEFDLLVACCTASPGRDSSDERYADRIRNILSRPIDWERLLHLADHHRVVPQVYSQLSAVSHSVPVGQFDALRLRYQDNARKTLWFTGELVRILSHLESAGIKALPYKGPVLAQILYEEVTQRQFGDLDILILPADVPNAKAAMLALGYKSGITLPLREERAYIETGYEYSFNAGGGRNLLELQWQIVPRFYSIDMDVAGLFEQADKINLAGFPVRTLRPQDLLLVLCIHAAKHVWGQLSWLCDIAQLVSSRTFDWSAIQAHARQLGIERILHLNLLLAHKLLDAPLPPTIQKRLRKDQPTIILADDILHILERSIHYNTESIPYFRLMMQLRERCQDRARFLWRLASTPSLSEWSAVQLPKHLSPLYRLVRVARLVKRLASSGPLLEPFPGQVLSPDLNPRDPDQKSGPISGATV